jgi:hypothetical protein
MYYFTIILLGQYVMSKSTFATESAAQAALSKYLEISHENGFPVTGFVHV